MRRRTRRINHTQRLRIDLARIQLRVASNDDAVRLSAKVDLRDLGIEGDAKVFLDVSRKAQSQRFSLGTAGRVVSVDNAVTSFDSAVGLRYDVVVVGAEDALLLAAARRVRPESPEGQESLLAIRPSSDLGERIWRLELDDNQPIIEVNDRILNWRDLTDTTLFQSLVLPQVVGSILEHIIEQGGVDETDNEDPLVQWASFFAELGVDLALVTADNDVELRSEQLDQAVAAFARRHRFATQVVEQSEWANE